MLDPDIPREAGEETGGAAGGVRIVGVPVGIASNTEASTPLQWTTAIVRHWRATNPSVDAPGPGLPHLTLLPNPSLCPNERMTLHASLHLSMICFSRRRSRKPLASLTSRLNSSRTTKTLAIACNRMGT